MRVKESASPQNLTGTSFGQLWRDEKRKLIVKRFELGNIIYQKKYQKAFFQSLTILQNGSNRQLHWFFKTEKQENSLSSIVIVS